MAAKKSTNNTKASDSKEVISREQQSLSVVKKYMLWSLGAGLVPVPLLDLAAVTGVQIKMIQEISNVYDVEFSENKAKNVTSAALSGITANTFAYGTVGSTIKAIPLVGTIIGSITMPFFSSASAYALGSVFINHFEKGGTFLDLNSANIREDFQAMFKKGKVVAADLKEEVGSEA